MKYAVKRKERVNMDKEGEEKGREERGEWREKGREKQEEGKRGNEETDSGGKNEGTTCSIQRVTIHTLMHVSSWCRK
jgi:hypothetical protein